MASESAPNEINQVVEPVGDNDCVVCLEPLANEPDARTLVTLRCSHQFHLDCIGSAFNCKKMMICPSCRKVEKGDWKCAAHPGQYEQPTFILERVLNDHLPISRENGPRILALPASSAWRGRHVLPNDVTHNIQNISNHPAMPNPLEPRNDFWVHDPSLEAGPDHEFLEQFSRRRLNDLVHGNGGRSVGTSNGRGTSNDGGATNDGGASNGRGTSNDGEASNGRGTSNDGGASNGLGTNHGGESGGTGSGRGSDDRVRS